MKHIKSFLSLVICMSFVTNAIANELIIIETDNSALVYNVGDKNRLYQKYFGKKLKNQADYIQIPDGPEALITHGME